MRAFWLIAACALLLPGCLEPDRRARGWTIQWDRDPAGVQEIGQSYFTADERISPAGASKEVTAVWNAVLPAQLLLTLTLSADAPFEASIWVGGDGVHPLEGTCPSGSPSKKESGVIGDLFVISDPSRCTFRVLLTVPVNVRNPWDATLHWIAKPTAAGTPIAYRFVAEGDFRAEAAPAEHTTSIVVAGAFLVASAGALIWSSPRHFFLGLFSRRSPSRMLDLKARAAVFEAVQADPGIHQQEIARRVGLTSGHVRYHVQRLHKAELVHTVNVGGRLHCFPGGPRGASERARAAVARHPLWNRLLSEVERSPGPSLQTLADLVGVSAPEASRILKRLEALGLVRRERHGRKVLHYPDGRTWNSWVPSNSPLT